MDDEQRALLVEYTRWLQQKNYLTLRYLGILEIAPAGLVQEFDDATADPEAEDAATED